MAAFMKLIARGSATALSLARSLLTDPVLINTGTNQGRTFAVRLECEDEQQSGSAEVSESLVIAGDKKQSITDNVAPGSWEWNLSGYIPGITSEELTNYFTPFVELNTNYLKMAFKRGYVLAFKDSNCAVYKNVVIKSLTISNKADCRNKKPFQMTLKEINVITTNSDNSSDWLDMTQGLSSIAVGSIAGSALTGGTTMGTKVASEIVGKLI